MTVRILVAEDESILRRNLCELLVGHGYEATGVADGVQALEALAGGDFDILVTDLRMPNMDGISLLRRVSQSHAHIRVLVTTAYASVETAVEALRLGAYDYILKPLTFDDLLRKIANLVELQALNDEVGRLRREVNDHHGCDGIIGKSPAMQEIFSLVAKVAGTRSTVLITGESGTGKEVVARAVASSNDAPFIAINAAALSEGMLESQLFGHEKGAFTGAHRGRDGCLRSARGGTVFLDEIAELSVGAQAKLLRAIETGDVLPVGADKPVKAEFRLVAATNQALEQAVAEGRFRQDLFYRLNVFRIHLPPLRERREDIALLAEHFLRLHSGRVSKLVTGVSTSAMQRLLEYSWPGNVRELSNVMERAVILAASQVVTEAELPPDLLSSPDQPVGLREAVQEFELRHIAWVLRMVHGNRADAAKMLKVDPATLYRRLAKMELAAN
ncbi:MAG: sigma-54-dependent Fis family transcriptional regulator [Deltaproteobacteria bacterium]|nr:sigma-54-dependent Fis family transcriptional regulator [Deltaproteobacteria bacterium]